MGELAEKVGEKDPGVLIKSDDWNYLVGGRW